MKKHSGALHLERVARPWSPTSWRDFPVAQAPDYSSSQDDLKKVEKRLRTYPTLVSEMEVLELRAQLARVAKGKAFLLQGGDCAESFDAFHTESIQSNIQLIVEMARLLAAKLGLPIVQIGRVAGQFAKPRSSPFERNGDRILPSYRGDILNGHAFTPESRRHDPRRMERAYLHSAATLNTLRTMARDIYTSHEALLLPYEEAFTRRGSSRAGDFFAGSAHMLWIGERTRQLDGAHVEYARGIMNPIGVKCGPNISGDELLRLLDRLNPQNIDGRMTLIMRLGVRRVGEVLPKLVERVKREGCSVVWCCDPMHGNTFLGKNGLKTRALNEIVDETRTFLDVHAAEGTVAGGVHLEVTGKNVAECVDGDVDIGDQNDVLGANGKSGSQDPARRSIGEVARYESLCDPRLNARQAMGFVRELFGD